MRYAIVEENKVVNVVEADAEFAATFGWIPGDGCEVGDDWDGEAFTRPAPVVDQAALIAAVQAAVQGRLDDFFRQRAYDGVLSASTYATSNVPKFKAEGQYAVDARDTHWARCYEILGAVQGGQRAMPTVDDVLAEMPPLEWPV